MIFITSIQSKFLYLLAKSILYFILEFLKFLKGFQLIPHSVDISISTWVISKSCEVEMPTSCLYWKESTNTYVDQLQHFCSSLTFITKRCLSHFPCKHLWHESRGAESNDAKYPSCCNLCQRFLVYMAKPTVL